MRNVVLALTLFLSLSASAAESWWVYSSGSSSCKVAKFSPWQVLENGTYQLDRYYKDKELVFLEKKSNTNSMLIFARSKNNCISVSQIIKQSTT